MRRIIVCVKPVPDPKHWDQVTMDPETQTLRREGIPSVLNPLDKHALEAALALRDALDAAFDAEVVLLSMAPPFAKPLIREGLAMGADRAVLLSDPGFAGSDTLATARILAAGIRKIGEFDLLLLGNLSVDGSTAQVCSQVAELLDVPSVMHVVGLEAESDGRMRITQRIENGHVVLRGTLPLALAVRKELNKPRYTPFTGIIAAETKEIQVLSNTELGLDPALLGLAGSPTKMAGLELRRSERACERLEGDADELVQQLVERLYRFGII